MLDQYEITAGSIPGRNHVGRGNLLLGKNNQDAYSIHSCDRCIIATVTDGCSSSAHSELGAQIAARIVPRVMSQFVATGAFDDGNFHSNAHKIKFELLRHLMNAVEQLQENDSPEAVKRIIHDCFLFTLVVAVITPTVTTLFAWGDGIFIINGEVKSLGTFENNAPPYLGYELLDIATADRTENARRYSPAVPNFVEIRQTRFISSLVLGSDGVGDLIARAAKNIPGKSAQIGSIEQLWQNNELFTGENNQRLNRWLRCLNSEVVSLVETADGPALKREPGQLPDDTTLIAIRKGATPC